MKTINTITLFLLLLLSAGFAYAQSGGGCGGRQVIAPPQPIGLGQPAPGAIVRVCSPTATGSTCSPLTPGGIFSDPGLLNPIANPFTADQNGVYSFCAAPGNYLVQEFPQPGVTYSFQVTVGIAPNGSYIFSGNNTFTGTNQFSGIDLSNTLCTGALAGFSVLCSTSAGPEVSINGAGFLFMPTIAGDIGGTPAAPTVVSAHITGGTVNTMARFNASGNPVPSACTDNASTVACTEPITSTGAVTGSPLQGSLGTITPSPAKVTTLNASALSTLAGGVCYLFSNDQAVIVVSASCGYTTWALALAACPSTGCILDGTAPDVPLALGAFDTGSNIKPVTVRLGPYNFTATQITVRQGLDLGGAGVLSTNITSNGTNAQPLFVNPQVNNNIITVRIHDFTANGLSGNTSQDGILFDASTLTNAGVQYSTFTNVIFLGFKGVGVHLKCTQNGVSGSLGCIQGNTFTNVQSTRPTGATGATQNALRIEGSLGQLEFWNCWFLGTTNDTGTNVFVGTSSTSGPYSIHFHGTTNQNGFAYLIDGANSVTTDDDHFENIKGAYNLATTSQLFVGLNFHRPFINSNVGVNAGSGYIINIPNTVGNGDVTLDSPFLGVSPDHFVQNNATNAASVRVTNARTFNSVSPTNTWVSNGVTGTLTPASTLDCKANTTVQLSSSGTSITTLKSTLMPGETITFYPTGGTAQFATGGNLSLGTQSSPLIIQSGDSVTFMRVDAGTPTFVLTANPSKPTVSLKKGTGAGNYTSASTSDVAVDGTNLAATITIPTGWKLAILASGGATSLTATVTVFVGIADGGTVVLTQPVTASGIGNFAPFALVWAINGDGAAHTIDLRYHTSNGADSVSINNASSTQLPTMVFNLAPSN